MKNISIFEGMRILLKILDFLVVSNLYVATGTFSLTWLSLQFYDNSNLELPFFVFFSTLFAYNFMRLVRLQPMLKEGDSIRHKSIFKYRVFLWVLCVVSGVCAFLFFLKVDDFVLYTLLFMGLISVAYSLPVYKKNGSWLCLRDVPSIKIILIAFVWAVVTSIFPMQVSGVPINWLKVLERFLFVFAITIPFDIRDLRFDALNLYTIPQVFGIKNARYIGMLSLLFAEGILFYEYFFLEVYPFYSALAIYLVYELSVLLVYKSHPYMPERYFTLGVEGASILLGLLFYLSKISCSAPYLL
tara:strand:- start:122 stop:1021 length:900 start_codon:yes stop_codon:yes gene_type:complete